VINTFICGDSETTLKTFPDESIDMILTSPPYDDIYTYGGFTLDFEALGHELFRVLKEGCVMVWVEGSKTKDFDESDAPIDHAKMFRRIGFRRPDTMVYQKSGFGKPEPPCRKRYVQAWEYMFVLSKGKIQKWHPIKDKPNSCAGMVHNGRTIRQQDGSLKINKKEKLYYADFGLRYNVWQIDNGYMKGTKDKIAYKHPARFAEELASGNIISYSDVDDVVLDPFIGSGTTAKMALLNKRKFIGIDLNPEYIKIANERMIPYMCYQI